MKYNTAISQAFGLVFFAIVMSGIFLTFSAKLALITLSVAFTMNGLLFLTCLYKSLTDEVPVDFDIHP